MRCVGETRRSLGYTPWLMGTRLLLTMGSLPLLSSCREGSPHSGGDPSPAMPSAGSGMPSASSMEVDLGAFRVGGRALGQRPGPSDFYAAELRGSDVFEDAGNGVEIGTEAGVLDYVFLTLESFPGRLSSDGVALDVGRGSDEAAVRERFGEPYWVDRSDGEVILFYEYAAGAVELQFEFPDGGALGFITMSRDGVLSTEEQRSLYGVDKPWPPK